MQAQPLTNKKIMLANISQFEALQAGANQSQSVMSVFNADQPMISEPDARNASQILKGINKTLEEFYRLPSIGAAYDHSLDNQSSSEFSDFDAGIAMISRGIAKANRALMDMNTGMRDEYMQRMAD